jgi:glycogen operon protein
MNAYHEDLNFEIPDCPAGWLRVIDTGLPPGDDLPQNPQPISGSAAAMKGRSLALLVAEPLMQGHQL